MKRWQKIALATAAVLVPILSCGRRSLVLMDVTVSGTTMFSDATLLITANDDQRTTFDGVALNQAPFRAGVYLPSDMTGLVNFEAEVDQGNCIVGSGTAMTDVSAGGTTGPIALVITPIVPCTPITDGGSAGSGGMSGSAGAGGSGHAGGSVGTGGSGSGVGGAVGAAGGSGHGGSGAGGTVATGGSGTTGRGGAGGVTGSGGSGAGGIGGSGTGKGGAGGSVSPVGNGGSGPGGVGGSAGKGGSVGSGGVSGTGTGGMGGCGVCPLNETCSTSGPGSVGTCVCTQTDAQACSSAGIGCGTTTNICNQKVVCTCPAGSTCLAASGQCSVTCTTGTGGTIVPLDENAVICPVPAN